MVQLVFWSAQVSTDSFEEEVERIEARSETVAKRVAAHQWQLSQDRVGAIEEAAEAERGVAGGSEQSVALAAQRRKKRMRLSEPAEGARRKDGEKKDRVAERSQRGLPRTVSWSYE